jgi:hypothetical protein
MQRSRPLTIIVSLLLVAALAAGTWYLLVLRFQGGDVYPAYSSLRADPLGAKALHDSLDNLPPVTARRHYRAPDKLEAGSDDAVIFLGVKRFMPSTMAETVDELARDGARVVITWRPVGHGDNTERQPEEDGREEQTASENGDKDEDPGEETAAGTEDSTGDDARKEDETQMGEVAERLLGELLDKLPKKGWGISVKRSDREITGDPPEYVEIFTGPDTLPRWIPFYSGLHFEDMGEEWQTVYEGLAGAMVLEKQEGDGSVVLVADSYLLSNEAMREDLYPALLTWLTAGRPSVIFNESHLGVVESTGIMTLVKRYRLTVLLGGLVFLFILYAWYRQVPLVTLRPEELDDGTVTSDKDQFSGLVNLLRRNIPPDQILDSCSREWEKSAFSSRDKRSRELAGIIKRKLAGKRKAGEQALLYNSITREITERMKR